MNKAILGNFRHPNLQTRFQVVITTMEEEEKRDMGESKITTTRKDIIQNAKWVYYPRR
jgi:hypothetical protein